ncbi:hypothetical protein IWQ57_003720 [Coemansia nantahalensis]|uniref:Uncharacterized protein n=1 Tax=Coemansia nantahalensis TaxID=2789366 RepID=A0ACC1JV21_9FUNG|nr:hypothetical protein IWQ57_003720 [Coemansia nantahalensis]
MGSKQGGGMGPAGLKRFPTAPLVLSSEQASAARGSQQGRGPDRQNEVAVVLRKMVEHLGTYLIYTGNVDDRVLFVPLSLILKDIPPHPTEKRRITGRVVRELLSTGEMSPDNAVTLAKLVTCARGGERVVFDLDEQLPASEKFRWLVLAGAVGPNGPIQTPTTAAQACPGILPALYSIANIPAQDVVEKSRGCSNGIIRLEREWYPGRDSKMATIHVVRLVEEVAERVLDVCATVTLFGSRSYGICKSSSDIDLVMELEPRYEGGRVDMARVGPILRAALQRQPGFGRVLWLGHARVPIIKFVYYYGHMTYEGDISFNNMIGPRKTGLIMAYMAADRRVATVLMLLKQWGERRQITNSNVLNSFGLMMMAIAFLIDEQVVPPLQQLSTARGYNSDRAGAGAVEPRSFDLVYDHRVCLQTQKPLRSVRVDGHECYFLWDAADPPEWRSPNKTPAVGLLYQMFQYYGAVFNPVTSAISPRLGRKSIPRRALHKLVTPEPRAALAQPNKWRSDLRLLAIEDPFELTVNCGRNAPAEWVEGLQWEMRRAAWAMHQSRDDPDGALLARLFLPPAPSIYRAPAVWASAFGRLMKALANAGKGRRAHVAPDMDLDRLEREQMRSESGDGQ